MGWAFEARPNPQPINGGLIGPHQSPFLYINIVLARPYYFYGPMLRAHSPPMGPKDRPKTQPISGLGWVGLWALWAILRSTPTQRCKL
ncbi:hypothetical protein N7524_012023 [Penicillium chrysogenum]|nr:hypothetical protein N7524_012023 [Penicillium chrysogenum]